VSEGGGGGGGGSAIGGGLSLVGAIIGSSAQKKAAKRIADALRAQTLSGEALARQAAAIDALRGAGGFLGTRENLTEDQRIALLTALTETQRGGSDFLTLVGLTADVLQGILVPEAGGFEIPFSELRRFDETLRNLGLIEPGPQQPGTVTQVGGLGGTEESQLGSFNFLQLLGRGFNRGAEFLGSLTPALQAFMQFFQPQIPNTSIFFPQFGTPAFPFGGTAPAFSGSLGPIPGFRPGPTANTGGFRMPFADTSFFSGLASLATAVGGAVQTFRGQPASFVSPATPALGNFSGLEGAFSGEANLRALPALGTGAPGCITPTIEQGRIRFPGTVMVPDGRGGFKIFKNMGAPILMSGDLAACRRVKRIGARVRRVTGKR